jgi:hypothetical protein
MRKKSLLLLFLIFCCFVPNVRGVEIREERKYLAPGDSIHFYLVKVIEGEHIPIFFETYDNPIKIWFFGGGIDIIGEYRYRGTFKALETTYLHIGFSNMDDIGGYIHVIIGVDLRFIFIPLFSVVGVGFIILIYMIFIKKSNLDGEPEGNHEKKSLPFE